MNDTFKNILFKGKRKDNEKWVKGDLIHRKIWKREIPIIRTSDDGFESYEEYDVIPETVSRCSGLPDKDRQLIFEGDIVEYNGEKHQVVFETRNGAAYFGIVISPEETWKFCSEVPSDKMKIVGNVWDS